MVVSDKVGIITYHSPYNFGSMLQAYATQVTVEQIGYDAEIINYQPTAGDWFYRNLYFRHDGMKAVLADLTMLPVQGLRKKRAQLFEDFMLKYYRLSPGVMKEPQDLSSIADRYAVAISGSDQVINRHSNELMHQGWEYVDPYLLTWTNGKKMSFSSSPSSSTDADLATMASKLKQFDYMSVREQDACKRLEVILGRPIANTCDPTLLLTRSMWEDLIQIKKPSLADEGYILYYSLTRPRPALRDWFPKLRELSKKTGLKVAVVTPLAGFVPRCDELVNFLASGPEEFVSLVKYASMIVTDSYHGTLFSVNFNKTFWTVEKRQTDSRKGQILERIGLSNRLISDISQIDTSEIMTDFTRANERIQAFRDQSVNYLIHSLGALMGDN